jgi:hypothetical protein
LPVGPETGVSGRKTSCPLLVKGKWPSPESGNELASLSELRAPVPFDPAAWFLESSSHACRATCAEARRDVPGQLTHCLCAWREVEIRNVQMQKGSKAPCPPKQLQRACAQCASVCKGTDLEGDRVSSQKSCLWGGLCASTEPVLPPRSFSSSEPHSAVMIQN